jgi:hypothetical protein
MLNAARRCAHVALFVSLLLADGRLGAQRTSLPRWTLSASPRLVIGDEADPAKTFSMIGAAVRLSTGEIAVVNRSSYELRVFDTSGRFIAAFGRRGSGPGEFQAVSWIGRSQDSLFLFDWRHARVSLYHARTLVPFVTIEARNTHDRVMVVGRLRDGAWLVSPMRAVDLAHPHGIYRDSLRIGLLAKSGRGAVTWLGTFPGQSLFAYNPTRAPVATVVGGFRFGPYTASVASGTRVWIGDGAQPWLLGFDAKGMRTGNAMLTRHPRSPDKVALARLRDAEAQDQDSRTAAYNRSLYDEAFRMRETPYFTRLLPGVAGEVWIEDYCPDRAGPCGYTAISPAGVSVADLLSPPGVRLNDVGLDYVVGVHTDADGIESVRMYGLARL